MSKFITRDTVQAVQDIPWEDVPVPEWGEEAVVRIMGLNGKEASAYSKELVQLDDKGNLKEMKLDGFMAKLVVKSAVDENFQRIFTDEDVDWLNGKSAKVLKRLSDVAQRLSGMGDEAQGDAAKNSNGTPGGDSRTDSP